MTSLELGIIAAIIYCLAYIRYIYAMVMAKNKPSRTTWLIWSVLGFVLLASYYSAGARDTIPLLVVNQIGLLTVFVFSLKYGLGGFNKTDLICFFGAAISLLFWWISGNPLSALFFGILTDLFGALPTIKKVIEQEPGKDEEDKPTWLLFLLGNSLNLLVAGFDNFLNYIYPLYLVGLCALISLLLFRSVFGSLFGELFRSIVFRMSNWK